MISWVNFHNELPGIAEPITESLFDMITANNMVEKINRDIQNNIRSVIVKHKSVYPVMTDREMAALYVAMSYEGQSYKNADSVAQYENKTVFVINDL